MEQVEQDLTLAEELNLILFNTDPLNTSCLANDCLGEYLQIAEQLADYIVFNYNCFVEQMLSSILCDALSIEESALELFEYVNKEVYDDTVSKIASHINNNLT